MPMSIGARLGMLWDWAVMRQQARLQRLSTSSHTHYHTADGAANPGQPIRTDSNGSLTVAQLVHRNSGDTSAARSAHISFENAGGTEQARVAGFRPAGTTEMALVLHAGALSEYGRIARTGEVGIGGANAARAGSALTVNLSSDLEIVDAGTAGATEAGWIKVEIGGTVMYLRAYSAI